MLTHFSFILAPFEVPGAAWADISAFSGDLLKTQPLPTKQPSGNLCTHRTGSALSLMPLSSGYPFLRHVGTASPLGRPKTAPKTAQETSWRPLEPPRDPPGHEKATQETPRDPNGLPGDLLGNPQAPQEPPKSLPKGSQDTSGDPPRQMNPNFQRNPRKYCK